MLPTPPEECGMNLTTENTKNTGMPSSSKHETKTLHEATKVAEGRGAGPRVCDPQQCPQLESLENTPTRRAASPLAAGRRPALRHSALSRHFVFHFVVPRPRPSSSS